MMNDTDDVRLLLDDAQAYAREFVVAAAWTSAGPTAAPEEALYYAGRVIHYLGRSYHWLYARVIERDRALAGLEPHRVLPVAERRAVDLAPAELAGEPRVRDAMIRHHRRLPVLESAAVAALCAAAMTARGRSVV